jgi:GNAT superfamily N-acetyltransferase
MHRVTRETPDSAVLLELVRLLDADLVGRYGELQTQYNPLNTLANVSGAVIAYDGERAVGCGCFRRHDGETAEIKRMFVRPADRGSGAARLILDELEEWAANVGCSRAILETGKKNVEALRFYANSGYTPIVNFGPYVGMENSVCLGKSLAAAQFEA